MNTKKTFKNGVLVGAASGLAVGVAITSTCGYFFSNIVFKKAFNELQQQGPANTEHLDQASQALRDPPNLAATATF